MRDELLNETMFRNLNHAPADSLFDDAALVEKLVSFGQTKDNLRSMAIASRSARQFAGVGPVTPAHLRNAISMKGAPAFHGEPDH